MSNQALAPSATQLAISSPREVPFEACVIKYAVRSVKGVTRERVLLNSSKLFSLCAEEIRSLMGIEKGNQLPKEVAEKLSDAINEYITKQVNRITPANALSFRRSFYADFRNLRVTDRVTAVGENIISLKEQKLGVDILLTEKNRALDDLMKKPNPDYDREANMKEQIQKLELIKAHIVASLAKLEETQQ
jgi:predicted transcriptional regulator